jgi:hypothetical protein
MRCIAYIRSSQKLKFHLKIVHAGRRLSLQSRSQFFTGWSLRGGVSGGSGKELVRSQTTIFGSGSSMLRGISGDALSAASNADAVAGGLFPQGRSLAQAPSGDNVLRPLATAAATGVFQRTLQEMFIQTQVQLYRK